MVFGTAIIGFRDENKQFAHLLEVMYWRGLEGWKLLTDCVMHTAGNNGTQLPVLPFNCAGTPP